MEDALCPFTGHPDENDFGVLFAVWPLGCGGGERGGAGNRAQGAVDNMPCFFLVPFALGSLCF